MKTRINFIAFIVGLVIFSAGLYLIYPPAMLISAGVILMSISIFGEGKKQ